MVWRVANLRPADALLQQWHGKQPVPERQLQRHAADRMAIRNRPDASPDVVGMPITHNAASQAADKDELVRAAAVNAAAIAEMVACRRHRSASNTDQIPASQPATLRHSSARTVARLRRLQVDANARAWGAVDWLAAVMCDTSCAGDGDNYEACCPAAAATLFSVQLLLLCIEVGLYFPCFRSTSNLQQTTWCLPRQAMPACQLFLQSVFRLKASSTNDRIKKASAGLAAGVVGQHYAAPLRTDAPTLRRRSHVCHAST
jgi:hypothetical protein